MSKQSRQLEYVRNGDVKYIIKRVLTSLPNVSGIMNGHFREIKTNYKRAKGEVVIDGNANCFIVLGRDRPGGEGSGEGGKGSGGASAIDIIAGHGGPYPVDRVFDEKVFTGKDFKNDSSRIYIAQRTNIDEHFSIPEVVMFVGPAKLKLEHSREAPAIGIKSSHVRVIARETIKLVTEHQGNRSDTPAAVDGGIDIIAGYNILPENTDEWLDLQPMVKGNNLLECIQAIISAIQELTGIVSSFQEKQKEINDKFANHTHQSGKAGLPTSTVVGNNPAVNNFKFLTEWIPDVISHEAKLAFNFEPFTSANNPKFINSIWNRVN